MPAALRREVMMFPRRQGGGKGRQPRSPAGQAKPGVSFRIPEDMLEFVADGEAAGNSRTQVILRMMEVARDAATELGPEWWDLEKRAVVERSTPGQVLGRLAKAAIEAEKKRK